MSVSHLLAKLFVIARKVRKRLLRKLMKPLFKKCGKGVVFDPDDEFSYATIELGDDIFIGSGACFGTITSIRIDDHVLLGPNVTIRGGNHNTSLVGKPMSEIVEKRDSDDLPVHIQSDTWIGSGAIILKGVTIGRGAVVGAGSIVTKDVPPYSVVVGNPARVMKHRGSREEIAAHEQKLYQLAERIDLEGIEAKRLIP